MTTRRTRAPISLRRVFTIVDAVLLALGACFLAQPTRDAALHSAGLPRVEPGQDARLIVGHAILARIPLGSRTTGVIEFLEDRGFDRDHSSGRTYVVGAIPLKGDTAILATMQYRGSKFYRDFLARCYEVQVRFAFNAPRGTGRLQSISVRDVRICS